MHLTAAIFAFAATVLFMFVLRPLAREIGLVDIPGGRKRHGTTVPLIGGIAMSASIGLASALSEQPDFFLPLILAIFLLVFVGTIDDKYDLPASVRLVAQAVASMLVVFGADIQVHSLDEAFFVTANLGPFSALFSLLFLVTLINAFNIVDGIDGLAGGLSLISLAALALLASGSDLFGLAFVSVFAVAGFLLFNLPMGFNLALRSFMGDAGSTFLGLTVGAIGISMTQGGVGDVSPVVGLWLVAIPVYDLFSAAMRRVMEKRSPFSPDHEHLHHGLMTHGLTARGALVVMLSLAAISAGIGLVGHFKDVSQGGMLIGWLTGLVLYYQAMRRPASIVLVIGTIRRLPQYRVD